MHEAIFLKEKLDLKHVMIALIKNSMIFRSGTYAVTTWDKMLISKEPANRKGWRLSVSILPQVFTHKMAIKNGDLLPNSTGYMLCSLAGNFPLFSEMSYELKLPTPHTS